MFNQYHKTKVLYSKLITKHFDNNDNKKKRSD